MQRRTGYILIAVSAWVLGLCWALSSPVGSSPDDDFHLTSIFCRTGDDNLCRDIDGAGPGNVVEVPKEVVLSGCFAFDPTTSGECWQPSDDTAKNDHWNYHGGYPPTFYAVMGVFASEDVARSVLIMRLVALTVALASFGLAAWA